MKCLSCEAEIIPKWKHAIDQNVCPFCGDTIMQVDCKQLLTTLTSTIEVLSKEYPDYLEDWLSSNFNFVPASKLQELESKLKQTGRVEPRSGPPALPDENVTSVQDQSVTNEFFIKAGVKNVVEKNKDLKALVSEIKKGNGPMLDANAVPDEEYEEDYSRSIMTNNQEAIHPAAFQLAQMSNKNGINPKDLEYLQRLEEGSNSARDKMRSGGGKFSR